MCVRVCVMHVLDVRVRIYVYTHMHAGMHTYTESILKYEDRGPDDPAKLRDFVVLRAVLLSHRYCTAEDRHVHYENDHLVCACVCVGACVM